MFKKHQQDLTLDRLCGATRRCRSYNTMTELCFKYEINNYFMTYCKSFKLSDEETRSRICRNR